MYELNKKKTKKKKHAPHPVSPLRYDSGLYVPVYRGDATRIIIGKGEGDNQF